MAHFLSASDFAIAAIEDELEDERRKYLLVAYLVLQLQKEEQKKKEWKKERQYRGPSLKPRLQALQRAQSISNLTTSCAKILRWMEDHDQVRRPRLDNTKRAA